MMGTESGGDPSDGSHLTGPQPVIPSRSSPDPRGSITGSGDGGVPPVGTHRPGPQGANTAGHRVEILPPTCRRLSPRVSGVAGLFKRLLRRPPDHNRLVPRLSRLRRLASPGLSPSRPQRKRRQRRRELRTLYAQEERG